MQIGLVGKPSSGKSSFFKAATMIDVAIAAYPFTTIKPNVGIGHVVTDCVCKYYDVKCNPKNSVCVKGKRYIPVKLLDVAGLVPDAHLGKGLGNKFLDDLRPASCLIHLVDASGLTDAEGKPTSGYDPCNDIRFLTREIDLWFAGIVKKGMSKYSVKKKFSKVDLIDILTKQLTGLGITKENIQQGLDKASIDSVEEFATELRSLSKPIIVAANKIDLPESEENLKKMKKGFPDLTIIPTSAAAEIALRNAKEKGLIEYDTSSFTTKDESKMNTKQVEGLGYIEKNVLEKYGSTGIQECLNKAVFDVLDYIVVYPVADINKLTDKKKNVLPDAFLVKNGTTLKEFAFSIHSDIGEKFIGGLEAKTKRKLGADYILQNNDVIEILFQKR
jgi:ribosome-binding ATPase YchF (GTP1/OBG family)